MTACYETQVQNKSSLTQTRIAWINVLPPGIE